MRRKARELAFRVLFEVNQGGVALDAAWHHATSDLPDDPDSYEDPLDEEALGFARRLVEGFQTKEAEVDKVLSSTIEGWSFGQMAKTDLTVLRIATYEALYEPTPLPPLIEVAVKIARRYGGEDSGRFVNGVLGRLARRMQSGELHAAVAKEP